MASWYSSPNYGQGLPLLSCCSNSFNFPSTVPARHLWQVRETSVLLWYLTPVVCHHQFSSGWFQPSWREVRPGFLLSCFLVKMSSFGKCLLLPREWQCKWGRAHCKACVSLETHRTGEMLNPQHKDCKLWKHCPRMVVQVWTPVNLLLE